MRANRCSPRTVVTLPLRENEPAHEREVHRHLARSLAVLLGGHYGGDHDPERTADDQRPPYFLPSTTIVGLERARALGIRDDDDLFGGVVDRAFICTKAITHPLTAADARRPPGWSDAFAQRTRDAVLPGWTAFSIDDLREGARRLLERGPARLKPVHATAGRGQQVLERLQDVDAALECFPGLYASRRNYDAAQGRDAAGRWCSGVLEQSWRVGGASAAEIGAMLALHADPALQAVRTCSYEVYGEAPRREDATVLYAGNDPELGELTKYVNVTIEAHGDT
ncbi:MAG: DUF3182 family protein [Burkholderiaceae bacterium]